MAAALRGRFGFATRATDPVSKETMKQIRALAARPQTGVSLQDLLEFGTDCSPKKLVQSAKFLHYELPVRYAHRVRNLEDLPHGLSDMPSVKLVKNWYIRSVEELLHFPKVETPQDELRFRDLIESIKNRHSGTLYTMAKGIHELKMELFRSFSAKNDSRKDIVDRAKSELWTLQGEVNIRVPISQGIAGAVVQSNAPINLDDAYEDPRFNKDIDQKHGYRTRSVLAMPLWDHNNEPIAVVQLINKKDDLGVFSRDDEELLGTFLQIAGPILASSQSFVSKTTAAAEGPTEFPGKVARTQPAEMIEMNVICENDEEEA